MARLGNPDDQPEPRQAACVRLRRAVAAHPFMVAGSGRFDTRVIELTGDKALIKTGAEGAYCAAFPELGLGDRTRVVSGKSVSVRVDLGGRRIIQKTLLTHSRHSLLVTQRPSNDV